MLGAIDNGVAMSPWSGDRVMAAASMATDPSGRLGCSPSCEWRTGRRANLTTHVRLGARSWVSSLASGLVVLMVMSAGLGCSQKLTRETAAERIVEHFGYPIEVVSTNYELVTGREIQAILMDIKKLELLGRAGVIDYTYNERWMGDHLVTVSLTDRGAELVRGDPKRRGYPWTGEVVRVKLGEEVFLEVTGVAVDPGARTARVEYSWRYGNLTPFGEYGVETDSETLDPSQVHTESVVMRLYDDGWRVADEPVLPW